MRQLEETNCEKRNYLGFELPPWEQVDDLAVQDEAVTTAGSKESSLSQTLGSFLGSEGKYAWLSHGNRLVVVDTRQGRCICSWNFPDKVTSVSPFPSEQGQVPLLLVGLDNNAIRIKDSIGLLCIFDCCASNVLTTIQVPAGVEKACIIHGGAEWEEFHEKRPDTVLSGNTGLIFAALRNLQHIVIDINRSLWTSAFHEGRSITSKLEFVNTTMSQMTPCKNKKEPTHLAYDLMDRDIEQYIGFDREDFEATPLYDESLCSVLLSSTKIGCLITGCLGRVIVWQYDGSIGWVSPTFDENAYVTHIALLEPSDDPRPFYYLWIACQNDSPDSSAVLRMYAMFFNKKYHDKSDESSLYFNLESEPSLKFELELERGERVHSLLAVERENPREAPDSGSRRGEESLLLIGTDERLLLFDLNRWYKEQMPRTMAECRNPNSVMASYRPRPDDEVKRSVLACSYVPRSLREFPTKGPSSPEELFFPNSLTLGWVELISEGLTYWLARGVQAELLREITIAGPIVLVKPTETYRRCLSAGLMPFDSMPQDYTSHSEKSQQREMLLSICLEQRWAGFLIRCATEWSDGSAAFLYPEFLRWGVQRASELKLFTDRLCVPLFDQSGSNIGECEVRTLRFCGQQLECLANVVARLPNLEADLEKQRRALRRIATYLQVLLWFHDVGLLPETQEEDDDMPQIAISKKIPYPKEQLVAMYRKKRRKDWGEERQEKMKDDDVDKEDNDTKEDRGDNKKETLFIDQLITGSCLPLKTQWEREADPECPNLGGYYPPPSLQTLLRSFLTDCHSEQEDYAEDEDERDLSEIECKHSITIYLLMDLAMLLQNTHPSIDQLIKYPSAFKLSPSLIKLTQAFWLLDHEDYDGFFKIMTGQLIIPSDVKDWQHKLAIEALLRNDQHKLALTYLRVLKPPLSTLDDQGTLITLSVEQGMVESAFHARPPSHYTQLLTRFFQACQANGKLAEILHLSLDTEEEEAFVKFLKESGCEDTRLLYYLQRCRHTEALDIFGFEAAYNLRRSMAPTKIHPTAMKMLSAFNATLPEITKRFASTISKSANSVPSNKQSFAHQQVQQHQLSFMDPNSVLPAGSRGYPRPMSQCRNNVKEIYEVAVSKTRETCLKAERPPGSANHVPFLAAPCTTIIYCSKANNSEQPDANGVLFPERKATKGKRTYGMMNNDGDESADSVERKRRRLESECEQMSNGDNERMSTRRLSMSQVCDTPLVQRKTKPMEGRDANGVSTETPHSILKIRQMLSRNSNSPGYGFSNSFASSDLKDSASGDAARSARQIRFSVERFSGDSSILSGANSSKNEPSKIGEDEESCDAEENYYSPNVSTKSLRDSSFLSDNSMTVAFATRQGPKPRPSLRRSSLLSRTSSDYHSNKSSLSRDTTLEVSAMETTFENKTSTNPSRLRMSTSLYAESILSPNTSVEGSPLKNIIIRNGREHKDNESEKEEDSEDEEQEDVANIEDTEFEDSVFENSAILDQEEKNDEMEEGEIRDEESQDEEVSMRNEEEKADYQISEDEGAEEEVAKNEISEDEEAERKGAENEISEDEEAERKGADNEISEDEGAEEEDDDTFQSLPNSLNNTETADFSNCLRQVDDDEARFSMIRQMRATKSISAMITTVYDPECSLTKNLAGVDRNFSTSEINYSLTRPIFMDNQGIMKLGDSAVDITDDESMDAEKPNLQSVTQEEEEEEEEDITLNVSTSSASDGEKKQQQSEMMNEFSRKIVEEAREMKSQLDHEKRELESQLEQETRSFVARLSESSISSRTSARGRTTPTPIDTSLHTRSRQASVSSTKSDETKEEETLKRRSSRQLVITPTPRRSIKDMSIGPLTSITLPGREKRSTSVTKEVKKILSNAIASDKRSESPTEKDQRSSVSKSPEVKTSLKSRTPSRQSSRESSEDKSLLSQKEESPKMTGTDKKPRTTRTSQKDKSQLKESAELSAIDEKTTKTRATRAGSVAKDTTSEKSSRTTRGASTTKETAIAETSSVGEETTEESSEKKAGKSRTTRAASETKEAMVKSKEQHQMERAESPKQSPDSEKAPIARSTRASSQAKDTTIKTRKTRAGSVVEDAREEKTDTSIRKTRAASVVKENDTHEEKVQPTTRKTRAASVSKEESPKEKTQIRKTRAASIAKDEESQDGKAQGTTRKTRGSSVAKDEETTTVVPRKTRASSQAKDTSVAEEEAKSVCKRATRASSLAKDTSETSETVETSSKKPVRRRAGSLPKDVPVLESSRLLSRNRRSTSLLKEVILEESLSQLDSPVNSQRLKVPRAVQEAAASSPAANTRSRRSSIQSMPEEIEEQPQPTKQESSRSRRAASVDSTVLTTGKRLTRSVLAKTSTILDEVILEESIGTTKSPKRQTGRRKRATSGSTDPVEEKEKEKEKAGGRPKRGRKASESKDFQFSVPEEAGEEPVGAGDECRTPTDFKFSEPTGLQKFISPVRDDKESDDVTTNLLRRINSESEQRGAARHQRRPRTCFILPKRKKDKAN